MSGFQQLAIVSVVVAGGLLAVFVVERSPPRNEQPNRPVESSKAPNPPVEYTQKEIDELFDDSLPEPFVFDESVNIREIELNRRAQRPAHQNRKMYGGRGRGTHLGASYDWVLGEHRTDGTLSRPHPAEPMPPTSCRSVEPAPKHPENTSGPHRIHDLAVSHFEGSSGFGYTRMLFSENKRGKLVAFGAGAIDRVELVSLLTEDEPSVYVLDEMATPALARQAKRRPLDEFERLGLDAVRRGEKLVWTPEAPKRMFGAIRAKGLCLECHTNAKRGDLLGAFTYYLEVPVDELAKHDPK